MGNILQIEQVNAVESRRIYSLRDSTAASGRLRGERAEWPDLVQPSRYGVAISHGLTYSEKPLLH